MGTTSKGVKKWKEHRNSSGKAVHHQLEREANIGNQLNNIATF